VATGKLKKNSSSVSFSISRWFRRTFAGTPSLTILTIAAIAYSLFIFGGGVFTVINHPSPSAYVNNQFYFVYPSLSSQFIADTIIAILLYGLGFAGLFLVYQSTKSAYKPRQAYLMLVIGVSLLFISYIFVESIIHYKQTGGQ
jgi:hypothetical protein